MRYGANPNARPARNAQSWRREIVNARKYAANADSTNDRKKATL